jgi:hypothetical protein
MAEPVGRGRRHTADAVAGEAVDLLEVEDQREPVDEGRCRQRRLVIACHGRLPSTQQSESDGGSVAAPRVSGHHPGRVIHTNAEAT